MENHWGKTAFIRLFLTRVAYTFISQAIHANRLSNSDSNFPLRAYVTTMRQQRKHALKDEIHYHKRLDNACDGR